MTPPPPSDAEDLAHTLRCLDRLAALGMQMAEAIAASPGHDLATAEAFHLVARCVRLTILLKHQLIAGKYRAPAQPAHANPVVLEHKPQAAAATGPPSTPRERIDTERTDATLLAALLARYTPDELVAKFAGDLGLPPSVLTDPAPPAPPGSPAVPRAIPTPIGRITGATAARLAASTAPVFRPPPHRHTPAPRAGPRFG